jgi:hypothetical protein
MISQTLLATALFGMAAAPILPQQLSPVQTSRIQAEMCRGVQGQGLDQIAIQVTIEGERAGVPYGTIVLLNRAAQGTGLTVDLHKGGLKGPFQVTGQSAKPASRFEGKLGARNGRTRVLFGRFDFAGELNLIRATLECE